MLSKLMLLSALLFGAEICCMTLPISAPVVTQNNKAPEEKTNNGQNENEDTAVYISKLIGAGNINELKNIKQLSEKQKEYSYSYLELAVRYARIDGKVAAEMITHLVNVLEIDVNMTDPSQFACGNNILHFCNSYIYEVKDENSKNQYRIVAEALKNLKIDDTVKNKKGQTPADVLANGLPPAKEMVKDAMNSSTTVASQKSETPSIASNKSSWWKWGLGAGLVAIIIYWWKTYNSDDEDDN